MPSIENPDAPAPAATASRAAAVNASPSSGAGKPAAPARKKRGPLFWLIMLALVIGAAWWVVRFAYHATHFETTDDAFLRGHVHQVGARVAGTVTEVLVGEHERVKAGQLLARIDAAEFEIALEKARAALGQAQAEELQAQAAITRAEAQKEQALAQVKQAQAQVTQYSAEQEVANVNFGRNQRLFQSDSRAVSKADIDTTRSTAQSTAAALEAAKANVEAATAQARASDASTAAAEAQLAAAKASVVAQTAAVRDAERELSYTEVKAPTAGQIGNKNVEVGNRVQLGQALFAVVGNETWVMANFKETQLRRMRAGQPVDITVDAVEGRTFAGRVDSFSPATGAQFALLPPDNATGNFTKVVQRVPVKITFDPSSIHEVEDRLHAGLSVVVDVRVK